MKNLNLSDLLEQISDKDTVTINHSMRVSDLCYRFCLFLGKDELFAEEMRVAGLLHDLGKITIPDEILKKPSRLTSEEYSVIKNHTVNGATILKELGASELIVNVAYGHHLGFNGNGYPDASKAGKDIPEECRIAAICDVFEALTAKRQYKEALPVQEVLEMMEGTLDPDLFSAFKTFINE